MRKDIDGKNLQDGHIVAVRYAWNSYVGIVRNIHGLSMHEGAKRHWAMAKFHPIEEENGTYQILGHEDPDDNHFNPEVFDWFTSEQEEYNCPVRIRVYDNLEIPKAI